MFDFLKKEKYLTTVADGGIINITSVPDRVFSQKILGDGFAVIPENGNFSSPTDGTITEVAETRHAYCITSDDGLEILVHIGIDTVELKGRCFTPLVKPGDRIKRGNPIARANLKEIEDCGYNTTTMVVITNIGKLKSFKVCEAPSVRMGEKAFIYKT